MPFISKDWRSPGETWVKTDEGWEKLKVLEKCKAIRYEILNRIQTRSIQLSAFFVLVFFSANTKLDSEHVIF